MIFEQRMLIAPRWKFWLARLFGERTEGQDDNIKVVAYRWRDRIYLSDMIISDI